MEKNCQAYIKIEKVGNTIVFHRCLNDVNNTTICKDHLLSQSLKENYDKKRTTSKSEK